MVKIFKRLNDRCKDLYEERSSLKDKIKTLLALPVDKGKKPLTPLVKTNVKCKLLNTSELEIIESMTFFFTHIELLKRPHLS